MPKVESSAGSRAAILSAAEAAFAERGFSGARVDGIAAASGFNKTLIFRHFGDKLGLYTEVLKRADEEVSSLQRRATAPLVQAAGLATNSRKLRLLLTALAETSFDFLVGHPRLLRILNWEAADGWRTFTRIATQFPTSNLERLGGVFHQAWRAGLLRSDFHPLIQLSLVSQLGLSYIASMPLYQTLLPGENLDSRGSLARARKFLVETIVHGLMKEE